MSNRSLGKWGAALAIGLVSAQACADTAFFTVEKYFDLETEAEVEVEIRCNTGLPISQSVNLGDGESITFVVTGFDAGSLDCEIQEADAASYEVTYDDGTPSGVSCYYEDVTDDEQLTCIITNVIGEAQAGLRVCKIFNDGNTMPVDVHYECNTGLPLSGTTSIRNGECVTFTIVEFDPGELDCRVTETVPAGYLPSYFDGTTSAVNCSWQNLTASALRNCVITNILDEPDTDGDGFTDSFDNCPETSNQDQADSDGDGIGDACDELTDSDGDGVADVADECPQTGATKVVDPDTGCSVEQFCPCAGTPDTNEPWKNQGQYLKCAKEAIDRLESGGIVSKFEAQALYFGAKASGCGG